MDISFDSTTNSAKIYFFPLRFYESLPGFKCVANYPDFVMFSAGNFYLGLTTHKGKTSKNLFSEFNIGLDHFSFEVKSKKDLENALEFFDKNKIPHGNIDELSNGLLILVFREPDNIQLELCCKEQ
ncbi:VOC family protein [Candidatus Collierbacteria bacterium]|nr:VOC family protein [Candidatus Collierbacteria bacterium]